MGVKGLWKLLEGTGQPVSLESMEGKVLAVDISIWLNMAVKGMRDLHGQSANDAHLITLFHRICKLLYFGVKPVFVFDGQAPILKQNTLNERRMRKHTHIRQSKSASEKLLQNYLKRHVLQLAIKPKNGESSKNADENPEKNDNTDKSAAVSTKSITPAKNIRQGEEEDLYKLPEMKHHDLLLDSSDDEREEQWLKRSSTREAVYGSAMSGDFQQMMAIDVNSDDFKSLPPDIQHELLNDIKEIRKRRRTQIEAMPEKSESFSSYQLTGLLAKRALSERIQMVEKQIQDDNSLSMSTLGFNEQLYEMSSIKANKLSSEDATHFVLIKGLRQKPTNNSTEVKTDLSNTPVVESSATEQTIVKANQDSDCLLKKHNDTEAEINVENEISGIANVEKISSDASTSKSDSEIAHDLEKVKKVTWDVKQAEITADNEGIPVSVTTASRSTRELNDVISLSSPETNIDEERTSGNNITTNNDHREVSVLPGSALHTDNPREIVENVQAGTEERPSALQNLTTRSSNTAEVLSNIDANYSGDDLIIVEESISGNKLEHDVADINNEDTRELLAEENKVSSDDDFMDVVENINEETTSSIAESKAEELVETENSEISNMNEAEPNPWDGIQDLDYLEEQMDVEDVALLEKMKSSERAARDVSDIATTECQHLLQLFGIPYMVSPQEAEAQCAYLNSLGLTTGTITEDSDIWLFGGRVVYKDVFDRKREPCCYSQTDIKMEMGLERDHFINIALCSGSDYTSGLEGVGPVRALEIMKEFPGDGVESLQAFRDWWDTAHKQVKAPAKETKIKGQLRRLNLPDGFPSQLVVDAYHKPIVNESKESFSWGMPDLDAIRDFAIERLHWTKGKVDENLLPILKRAAERKSQSQTLLSSYFPRTSPMQKVRQKKSKRVLRAITPHIASTNNADGTTSTLAKSHVRKVNIKSGGRKRTKKTSNLAVPQKLPAKSTLCLSESSSSDTN